MARPCKGTDEQVLARLDQIGKELAALRREKSMLLSRMKYRRKARRKYAKARNAYAGRTYDDEVLA